MKRFIMIAVMSFSVLLGAAGCGGEAMGAYKKITPNEAKVMMEESKVTLVDVRTEAEYKKGHIPGAILVPNETIGNTMPEQLPDKKATIMVYCRSGARSKQASDKLIKLGYEKVYDLGGIIDWPYEIEK